MGGWGTFLFASRQPHLWASGRPTCGFGGMVPVENLLHVPFFSTHSDDDWVVSVLGSRAPLAHLRSLGGRAVQDETTGLGHAAWEYAEGNRRATEAAFAEVLPDPSTLRRLVFTALDGNAATNAWASVAEWGRQPAPASFAIQVSDPNRLAVSVDNVTCLRLQVAGSPLNRHQPLWVSVDGGLPVLLDAPLPASVDLRQTTNGWTLGPAVDSPQPLHTPGGPSLVYEGAPLLIVRGTADPALTPKLADAARIASRSPSPAWPADRGDKGAEGVYHNQLLYGSLPIKADTEVTAADLASHNLVLIGTAAQNTVVAQWASALPVAIQGGRIVCSDGVSWDARNRAVALMVPNPAAPARRLLWVASEDPSAYAPGLPALEMSIRPHGADLLVTHATAPQLVATRSFDPQGGWVPLSASEKPLPAAAATHAGLSELVAIALRRRSGADFAVTGAEAPAATPAIAIGETRASDLAALAYHHPVLVAQLTGKQLQMVQVAFAALPATDGHVAVYPAPDPVDPDRIYRVVFPFEAVWPLAQVAHLAPAQARYTPWGLRQALLDLAVLPLDGGHSNR
jgi:hypothetical protein